MKDTIEIRWHGRGGQGAKTAALLLADVAFKTGKYVQGFPEYGPERMGAPITAYNRISNKAITVHSNIYEPDYVVVVDESLLDSIDVTKGLNPEGAVIINSMRSKEEIEKHLHGYTGAVYTVNAKEISIKALGKNYPNSPMLAATVAVSKLMNKVRGSRLQREIRFLRLLLQGTSTQESGGQRRLSGSPRSVNSVYCAHQYVQIHQFQSKLVSVRNLTMTIARDAASVQRYVHLVQSV